MLLPDKIVKELLIKSGQINAQQLANLEIAAQNSRIPLQEAALEKDIISDENLGIIIADYLKFPFINLSRVSIPDQIFAIVPERIARKHKIVSFAKDSEGLKIATSDPTNTELLAMISKKTMAKVNPYYATEHDIDNSLQSYRKDIQETFDDLLQGAMGANISVGDAPIAKIVDMLITYAYRDKSSDIHIEPEEKNTLVRFRIDGILHDILYLDKKFHERILTRIKILSRLRTDEHLSAQDGKMRMVVDDINIDLRVSIIPISEGEKCVMRLLASQLGQISLLDLGMGEKDLTLVNSAINKSFGMILSTGPTGSGKTTTIYSILKILNTREKNITTIEDPIEYRIKGVNQIQVNPKTNLTFASGLRSILRQDPNVIFVGEIRDSETAGIAVNAALTGHLVVSTVHTNDSATTLPRLIDMKVEPFLVASTINLIIAQRLVRKICEMCKTAYTAPKTSLIQHFPDEMIKKYLGDHLEFTVFKGQGCKICRNTGYTGRVGVFEVLEVSNEIKRLITNKSNAEVITHQAMKEGMKTMIEDGLEKIAKGATTIEEVIRVTKVES